MDWVFIILINEAYIIEKFELKYEMLFWKLLLMIKMESSFSKIRSISKIVAISRILFENWTSYFQNKWSEVKEEEEEETRKKKKNEKRKNLKERNDK